MYYQFHKHRPQRTGRRISAGFRKNNLPPGQWTVICMGDEYKCAGGGCDWSWIMPDGFQRLVLLETDEEQSTSAYEPERAVNY